MIFSFQDLIKKAIDTSISAQREWEQRPLQERAEIFHKAGELVAGKYRMDLMAATMLGQGKTIVQAEIDTACELADFYNFNVQWAMVSVYKGSSYVIEALWNGIFTQSTNKQQIMLGI